MHGRAIMRNLRKKEREITKRVIERAKEGFSQEHFLTRFAGCDDYKLERQIICVILDERNPILG